MDGHREGLFQLIQLRILVQGESPSPGPSEAVIIEGHSHGFRFYVYPYYPSRLAVKDTFSVLTKIAFLSAVSAVSVVTFTFIAQLIIVFYLHHPVSLAEDLFAEFKFFFIRFRRIEHLLEFLVQLSCAQNAFFDRGKDLYVIEVQALYDIAYPLPDILLTVEPDHLKIRIPGPENRIISVVYPVSVGDYVALFILPVDPVKEDRIQAVARYHVAEYISRPYRRKLILVAHQYEPGILPDGFKKSVAEKDVHHGGLVYYHAVIVQRIFGILSEGHGFSRLIVIVFEKPVDSLCEVSSGLHYPLGSSSRRSRYSHLLT